MTKKRFGDSWPNAHGRVGFKSKSRKKYQWMFTITKRTVFMLIGIISEVDLNADYSKIDYGCSGAKTWKSGNDTADYGVSWNTGDKVCMIVDFGKKELSYTVNGQNQGIAHRDIIIGPTYQLAVSMYTGGVAENDGDSFNINGLVVMTMSRKNKMTYWQHSKVKMLN